MSRVRVAVAVAALFAGLAGQLMSPATAAADNRRLNDSVVANVYTIQHEAGCQNAVRMNRALQQAAQWHAVDLLHNRALDADIGSDGSTAQDRAAAANFHGAVAETVAIDPSVAINNIDVLNQWYYQPTDLAIMRNCANTVMGVWSENSLDRSVVVAVYGQPD
ncbi:CAP domain-containing protein [Mycobacterium sp. CVI_P3]|uniref:CAP domain-containing protein n=1 Tax=Mycobacterium pinniadriaticum TaxID=2994102 RepID=A0ABT3SEL9_9MYCO|nr:CAP domain-containing protein [Mycobacterium pinniadriaticum]MCX2931652.1 CAP domain-containing protein [Mycobacterium pinniadriaticum]MCX2937956.1 CAP domain-containing protein [Mycobacterium pinniadriaticum]